MKRPKQEFRVNKEGKLECLDIDGIDWELVDLEDEENLKWIADRLNEVKR